jgi:lipopolysaccharide export LptBFGC system permease protein LptF
MSELTKAVMAIWLPLLAMLLAGAFLFRKQK